MTGLSRIARRLFPLLLALLGVAWFLGAERQAVERHCYAVDASKRESFGPIDYIVTGWDWPIHWMKGTLAQAIPCKPGVAGLGESATRVPKGSMVGNVLEGKDGEVAPGAFSGSLPVSDSSSSALGPEARGLLEKRLRDQQ